MFPKPCLEAQKLGSTLNYFFLVFGSQILEVCNWGNSIYFSDLFLPIYFIPPIATSSQTMLLRKAKSRISAVLWGFLLPLSKLDTVFVLSGLQCFSKRDELNLHCKWYHQNHHQQTVLKLHRTVR